MNNSDQTIVNEFEKFIENKIYPCIAAQAALSRMHVRCLVVGHMACPSDDPGILSFIYDFVDTYRVSTSDFHSAVVIFKGPEFIEEKMFDSLLWLRLQALTDIDSKKYSYDTRVSNDPESVNFSFSLKEEAFFVIGLNPSSSRPARKFKYPALIFNPHSQFEKLRESNRYEKMKNIVRKRDIVYSGSLNPMLKDHGTSSEVNQYSGVNYSGEWQCPLKISHKKHD